MTEEGKGFTLRNGPTVGTDAGSAASAYGEAGANLPPIEFSGFLYGLGQMALVHLGEVPEPSTGETLRDLEQARHTIDILDLLEQKTRGNLTEEEKGLLQYLLSDLKLRYVRLTR